ncbi:unnamed protein product [Eruca vesicaria subsp. sativa]|uniref:F-box domain-containing protein n=1 Tax=Eruca vesicaria subsp. sativa TaxID=29727 RepID=A0ABC8LUP7_ERUVS|nr:unnamed protein product [Eruca vesicaria subsp. sativa]
MSFTVSANAENPPPKCTKTTLSSLPLPDEMSTVCFAYVPRCDYPSLSQVSKTFNQLIASSYLYRVRSLRQSTEKVLYIALRFSRYQNPIWYTLNQKPYKEESNSLNHKLVPCPKSFPSLSFWGSNVIVIGKDMYVLGGGINGGLTTDAFAIDCITRTCRSLPSMRVARHYAAFGVVDDKIYVLGGCDEKDKSSEDWVEVFNLKNQTWESFQGVCNKQLQKKTFCSVVMNEKIYIMDRKKSFVYDPKKNKWARENSLESEWPVGSCVIDNMLYTFGTENGIRVYNPKARIWRVLKGVNEDLPDMRGSQGLSRMANHGGKLVILLKRDEPRKTNIWCSEIAIERRGQGEVWGKVLWTNLVISFNNCPSIAQCLDVII